MIVVNCKWSAYSKWTKCSRSCGGGIRTSTRKIEQEALNGGTPCIGEATRNETCNSDICPGISINIFWWDIVLSAFIFQIKLLCFVVNCVWSPFGNWSKCSKTCGGGEKVAERNIITEAKVGGKDCEGSNTKIESCNKQPCPGTIDWI